MSTDRNLRNANDVESFSKTNVSIPAGGSYIAQSGLTTVSDVSVFLGVHDITSGVGIDVSGGDVTVFSNVGINNLTIRINGNG